MSKIIDKSAQLPEREMRCLAHDLRVEQRADGEEQGREISGYAATFNTWSSPIYGWFEEKISRGAFDNTDFSKCIACFNHQPDTIMARTSSGTLTTDVDEHGLKFKFQAPNTTAGNDLLENIKRGDITECSFVFNVDKDEWIYANAENGLEHDQRTITSISKVWDISPVVRPAYGNTEVSARSALEKRKEEYISTQSLDLQETDHCGNIRERNVAMRIKNTI